MYNLLLPFAGFAQWFYQYLCLGNTCIAFILSSVWRRCTDSLFANEEQKMLRRDVMHMPATFMALETVNHKPTEKLL